MDDCVFCLILAGELPASFVHEGPDVVAFMDIQPATPGHLLVIPRDHHADLSDVRPDIAAEMMIVGQRLGAAMRETTLRVDGINLFYADGEPAGQEVFHAHLHVIPRWDGDGFLIQPTYGELPGRSELDRNAGLIREADG
ncbi:MAG: HIT family protein [Acidimicrobiales bacterium]|nr:MAG: HIT family protein [Acidimicrobiales bacterium]